MTKEQLFFLNLLSDHFNGRKTEPQADLDWDQICTYAANHEVNGILYHQCRSFLPEEKEAFLSQKYASEVFFYVNRGALHRQLFHALSEAGIPFYTVKGLDVAQYYPVPALRTMGDSDLVVRSRDRETAHEVMTRLGFVNSKKTDIEWIYHKSNLVFELHDRLLYDMPINSREALERVGEAWDHAKPTGEGSRYALDWSFHFLFLLLHLRKHLVDAGVGFRHFMDLAAVLQHCELDWDWLRQTLEELNLTRFARILSAILDRWFSTPLQLPVLQLEERFYEDLAEQIFNNGVFGMNAERNRDHVQVNALTLVRGPRWLVRIRKLVRSVFPPYRDMRYVKAYAFLNGRPWLLPAAWGYRFYRSIRSRMGGRGKQMIDNAFISDERLDARQQELAKWGL